MNIEDHFNAAEAYLEMANEKVERQNYTGAQTALTKAYSHTTELLDHVQKLVDLKTEIERPAEGDETMNIDDHIENSKKGLDLGRERIASGDYDSAIHLFASAYSDVRELMEHAWRMKRKDALAANPAGENV